MEILLYQNRLQLATDDALYSDGDKYKPATMVANELNAFLPVVKNVLVLGSGLGSMVYVVRSMGFDPLFTLVEYDKVVLRWALEFLEDSDARVEPVCADAANFMRQNTAQFDLVFIDIFDSMVVPDFVGTTGFLGQCRSAVPAGGYVAFNYIANDSDAWQQVQVNMATVFPGYKLIVDGVNRVFIAAV